MARTNKKKTPVRGGRAAAAAKADEAKMAKLRRLGQMPRGNLSSITKAELLRAVEARPEKLRKKKASAYKRREYYKANKTRIREQARRRRKRCTELIKKYGPGKYKDIRNV